MHSVQTMLLCILKTFQLPIYIISVYLDDSVNPHTKTISKSVNLGELHCSPRKPNDVIVCSETTSRHLQQRLWLSTMQELLLPTKRSSIFYLTV